MMKCRKCGQEVKNDDKFCSKCGEPVIPEVPQERAVPQSTGLNNKIIAAVAAVAIVLAAGGFYVYSSQKKAEAELETAKIQEEQRKAEEKEKEEEEKKAAEEAKKKEEEEKKAEEEAKKKEEEAQQSQAQTVQGTPYVVLSDVVNGVYLHTVPVKGDDSNVRGTLYPGNVVNISEVFQNTDCTWGKTSDGYYVCIYETWTTENKPVGQYMAPVN
ncbi:MAG: zinc ribbon domain-containing protein [Erysipelotrichaceae bacterium]|nr:zinc ribbon domain-containing protein [Erysipelotrichaceae bacterium]